jgi:hypothetical protein
VEWEVDGREREGEDVGVMVEEEDRQGVVGQEWNCGVAVAVVVLLEYSDDPPVAAATAGGGGVCVEREISSADRETDFSQIRREWRSRCARVRIQVKRVSRRPIVGSFFCFFCVG